ncbi:GGDEF domain-containing protein [Pelotomaculum terephthalicicum JT]|uniref:CBS domain-containing protein n=1 Tax=Pelotomaculum terephthalicicum TaxID=206393 RepID=UPI001F04393F|nr:GGDEF domain-containing protein [Pelotomaculum terephthalicicum]MCG9966983.1 GGDEF domain-containing protein [Pelotomaculum terephthalicicum JT]
MLKVFDVMSSPVITADVLDSVSKAALIMEKNKIGGLPVLDERKQLCGIITSRDVRRVHHNRIVADAMSKNVVHVNKYTTLWDAKSILEEKKLERLPVLEGCKLVGIITRTDILVKIGRHTDPLTGLMTGSYIRYLAENILKAGNELTVIFFDLNGFGLINKKHGHVYGDRCLKIVGQIFTENTSGGLYFPGRYAGDEFIVVTTEKKDDAGLWANEIIKKIVNITKKKGMPVNIAAGVAGGRRKNARMEIHLSATVDDLINSASLASTLSKQYCVPVTFSN